MGSRRIIIILCALSLCPSAFGFINLPVGFEAKCVDTYMTSSHQRYFYKVGKDENEQKIATYSVVGSPLVDLVSFYIGRSTEQCIITARRNARGGVEDLFFFPEEINSKFMAATPQVDPAWDAEDFIRDARGKRLDFGLSCSINKIEEVLKHEPCRKAFNRFTYAYFEVVKDGDRDAKDKRDVFFDLGEVALNIRERKNSGDVQIEFDFKTLDLSARKTYLFEFIIRPGYALRRYARTSKSNYIDILKRQKQYYKIVAFLRLDDPTQKPSVTLTATDDDTKKIVEMLKSDLLPNRSKKEYFVSIRARRSHQKNSVLDLKKLLIVD